MSAAAVALALAWRNGAFRFVDGQAGAQVYGVGLVALRVGLVLAIALALGTYDSVVRGPDRGVLDVHPMFPRPYLAARLRRVIVERSPWLGAALLFGLPLLRLPAVAGAYGVFVVGAWCSGIGVGLGVNLGAPRLATSPSFAPLLDAIRGNNPREQAPFLYAPGVAVAVAAGVAGYASRGVGAAVGGVADPALLAPFVAAAVGLGLSFRNAPQLAFLPGVLGEIDARHAGAEVEEEARRVYLEWLADRAPSAWREELRKVLRHGWRGHRASVFGAWGLGVAVAVWVQTDGGHVFGLAAPLAVGGVGLLGERLRRDDPPWLDVLYPRPHRRLARAVALVAWAAPILGLGGASAWFAGGGGGLGLVLGFVVAIAAAGLPLGPYLVFVVACAGLGGWA